MIKKPTLLLQGCCGPCSTAVIKKLEEQFDVYLFFWGSNIFPKEEYDKRLEALMTVNQNFLNGKDAIVAPYNEEEYLESVKGLEKEPEGGYRCEKCFELRMYACAKKTKEMGYNYFASTLSVSPHKNAKIIAEVGKRAEEKFGVKFFEQDFKKENGFLLSTTLSKELGIYRQNYCGCKFSIRK